MNIIDWLQHEASQAADPASLLTGLCARLLKAAVPLDFAALELATLHPLMTSSIYEWRRGGAQALETPRFHDPLALGGSTLQTPSQILQGRDRLLIDLTPPAGPEGWPALADLRERGSTAYLVFAVTFSDRSRHALAFATDREGGFERDQAALLGRVARTVASALEILALRQMIATLMTTYLGRRTGQRVLDGLIQRGDGETVNAVLWYSDLRNFTAHSQVLARDAILDLLNAHFERLVAPIKAFGGEVLKFIGDGLLAIFPIDSEARAAHACGQAIKAVRAASAGMTALNRERESAGQSRIDFGIALHLGDVMYGNIGAPDRLDFTVIGPTVNLASRLEGLCKPLGRQVLASAAFAESCSEPLDPCGAHRLPGIDRPVEVFTLDQERPGRANGA